MDSILKVKKGCENSHPLSYTITFSIPEVEQCQRIISKSASFLKHKNTKGIILRSLNNTKVMKLNELHMRTLQFFRIIVKFRVSND